MEVPIKLQDLLQTVPQLKTALLNTYTNPSIVPETNEQPTLSGGSATDPMLLIVSNGRHPMVVEMGILGTILTDTIGDGGSGVNVLPEDTWKKLDKPTLWLATFNLLGVNQHGIKPLGTLMAQQVTIGTTICARICCDPLKEKGI